MGMANKMTTDGSLKYFAILVISLYILFIGVLAYEFIEMSKDHRCWELFQNGEQDEGCIKKYGFRESKKYE